MATCWCSRPRTTPASSPAQGVTAPQYAAEHVAAVEAAGYEADVYDVDANKRTAPHHLGVLSPLRRGRVGVRRRHHPAGARPARRHDRRRLRSPSSSRCATTSTRAASCWWPGRTTGSPRARTASTTTTRTRRRSAQRRWTPTRACRCSTTSCSTGSAPTRYVADGGTDEDGNPYPVTGVSGAFNGFEGDLNAPGSAENQGHTASFLTHVELPAARGVPAVRVLSGRRLGPARRLAVRAAHRELVRLQPADDVSYKRLTRTIDLTGRRGSLTSGRPTTPRPTGTTCSWRRRRSAATTGRRCRTSTGRPARAPVTAVPRAGTSCTRSWGTTRARTARRRVRRVSGTPPAERPTAGRSGRST